MAQNWSSSDLALAVPVPPGPRFGARLQDAVRHAVRTGTLPAGDALPASRDLAAYLHVARGTVVESYEQLSAEGYLATTPGGRTRVSATAGALPRSSPERPAGPRVRYDLRPGVPDLSRFPAGDWAWAYGESARRVHRSDLDYSDGRGHPHAREVVAAYLRRVRAADAMPERLLLANGFAQCGSLALEVLAARGVRVLAVEDPGDQSLDRAARAVGMRVAPIAVDASGIDVDRLRRTDAQAVLVTPAHQSPTGAVLSPSRRVELVEWAAQTNGWIIEDDYDSEFRYDRQPIGSLQGLAPERVLLIGSASKTHAPGVRLAWMASPASLSDDIAAARRAADRGGSVIGQLALAALIESGRHGRHVRAMRAVYSARRSLLAGTLRHVAPDLALSGLAAGFHGVLGLPEGVSEEALVASAEARSIRIVGLRASTRVDRALPESLVLGFGNVDDESLVEAVGLLVRVIAEHRPGVR